MRTWRWMAAVALGVSGISACKAKPATALVVALRTDATSAELSSLDVTVTRDGVTRFEQLYTLPDDAHLPGTITLSNGDGEDEGDAVSIVVTGKGVKTVTRTARLGFVHEKTKLLRLGIQQACFGVSCPDGATCDAGRCVPIDVDASTLPDFVSNADAIAGANGGAGGASGAGVGGLAGSAGATAGSSGAGVGGAKAGAGGLGSGCTAGATGGVGGTAGKAGSAGTSGAAGKAGGAGASGAAGKAGGASGAAGSSGAGGVAGTGGAAGSSGTMGTGGAAGSATCGTAGGGGLAGMSGTTFVPTTSMAVPHAQGFADYLPAIGKVFVTGGFDADQHAAADAELYDPAQGTWEPAGTFGFQSAYHVVLPDGRLFAGTSYDNAPRLFQPTTKTWSTAAPQLGDLSASSAIVLSDGRVLVAGAAVPEIYDPMLDSWSLTGPMIHARDLPSLLPMPGGKVLAIGGFSMCLADTEVFDPQTGMWTAGPVLTAPRGEALAALLPSGDVLVFAGNNCVGVTLDTSEVLTGGLAGTFVAGPTMAVLTDTPIAVSLASGKVLVAGGYSNTTEIVNASAQVYDPMAGAWTSIGPLVTPRYLPQLAALPDGRALIAGGEQLFAGGTCVSVDRSAELYAP